MINSDWLAYDSYYKRDIELPKEDDQWSTVNVSLSGPLSFWIGILVIAMLIQLVVIPLSMHYGDQNQLLDPYINAFANYVIFIPGIIVLPLIAALWIGDKVSNSIGNHKTALASKGIINALYAAMVYIITITIIYIIMVYLDAGVLSKVTSITFIEYLITVPLAIIVVVVPLFALLSASRHYNKPPQTKPAAKKVPSDTNK